MFKRKIIVLLSTCLLVFGCGNAGDRPPAVAGQFYPSNPDELKQMVDGFLAGVPEQKLDGRLIAFLTPHAGYVYCGQTAAYDYKFLKGSGITTVIIIGNSHHMYLSKGAIYAKGAFDTPIGKVYIDEALAAKIMRNSMLFEENIAPHMPEHSIEVQLPFLERTLGNFKIVPILLSGGFSLGQCSEMATAISDAVKTQPDVKKVLIIASSDMSHYPSWANANMADQKTLKAIEKFDPAIFKSTIDGIMSSSIPNEECAYCGPEAIYTTMYAAKDLGADTAKVLKYTNSGDATNDKSRVVGYGAVVFTNSKDTQPDPPVIKGELKENSQPEVKMDEFKISEKNQKELLRTARASIESYLRTGKMQKVSSSDPELKAPAAVFVTLTEKGDLRGCIGTTAAQGPLIDAVNQMAAAAAFEDYRFSQVTEKELKDINIEISILSPMRRVKSADEIKQNVHGVVVRHGSRSGLFLPQVWEHFSTKEAFLSELSSQKAGLPRDAWRDPDTELYVFTVFPFDDRKQ